MNFPQKAVIKLNNTNVAKFEADKPNKPKRRDKILTYPLSSNLNTFFKKG